MEDTWGARKRRSGLKAGEFYGPKTQHPPGEEIRRVSFLWTVPREEVRNRPNPSSPGRRSALTKFLSPVFEGAKPSWKTAPAGGGGPADTVFMASDREEVKAGRIRQGRGGGRPCRNSLERPAGDRGNLAPVDAEVVELAVRKAVQLGNGVPVTAPVAVVADQVHLRSRRLWFGLFRRLIQRVDRLGRLVLKWVLVHSSNANCAMQH